MPHTPVVLIRALLLAVTGAGALIFELGVARLLAVPMGGTVRSAAAVVAVFLGGLAAGAVVFGRRADRSPRPLRRFAVLSVAGGALALLAPLAVAHASGPLLDLAPIEDGLHRTLLLLPLAWIAAGLPALCFGGTLPAMVARAAGSDRAVPGLLYGANTLGSVIGTALAGFVLIERAGVQATMWIGALLHLAAAGAAFALDARGGAAPATATLADPPSAPMGRARALRAGLTALAAGFGALGLEVAGTRLLMQFLPSSAWSFAAVLAVFLVGTAAGSGLGAWLARRWNAPAALVPILLAVLAATAAAAGPWVVAAGRVLGREGVLVVHGLPLQLALALCVLPATLASGALFAVLAGRFGPDARPGRHLGAVYGWNTAGAVAGALLVGFVLLPGPGIRAALLACAALPAAAVLAWIGSGRMVVPAAAAALLAPAALAFADLRVIPEDPRLTQVVHHDEGLAATVIVAQAPGDPRPVLFLNRTSKQGGGRMARLLERRQGLLPAALRGDAESALALGVGTGETVAALVDSGIRTVHAVELVPEVFRVLPLFAADGRSPLDHPGVQGFVADAAAFVRETRRRYDLIVGDLFFPWIEGAGTLYSLEHFEAVRAHLNEGGLFCQWVPLHQLQWQDFGLLARTFARVFPQTTMFLADPRSALPIVALVGTVEPFRIDPAELEAAVQQGRAAAEYREVGFTDAMSILELYLGDQHAIEAVFGGERALGEENLLNTLDRPVLEYRAARAAHEEPVLALTNLNNVALQLNGAVTEILVPPPTDDPRPEERSDLEMSLRRRASAMRQFLAGHYWRLRAAVTGEDAVGLEEREAEKYLQGLVYDPHYQVLNDAALALAQRRFSERRYTAAAAISQAVADRNTENPDAPRMAGLSFLFLGESTLAAAALERAATLAPKNPAVLSALGIALYLNNEPARALEALTAAQQNSAARLPPIPTAILLACRGDAEAAVRTIEGALNDAVWGGVARRVADRIHQVPANGGP